MIVIVGQLIETTMKEKIIGKYEVLMPLEIPKRGRTHTQVLLTDNPREAVWVANMKDNYILNNICGDRQFEKTDKWRIKQGSD